MTAKGERPSLAAEALSSLSTSLSIRAATPTAPFRSRLAGTFGPYALTIYVAAQPADLTRVQRRTAGTLDSVRAGHLADHERVRNARLPPLIDRKAAILVLRAQGDLQGLFPQVDPVLAVNLNRGPVHVLQPLDRQRLHRAGLLQILQGLALQAGQGKCLPSWHGHLAREFQGRLGPVMLFLKGLRHGRDAHATRVIAEIHEHPPAVLGLVEYQHVDERRLVAFNPLWVKWPLVALQEDRAGHAAHGWEETAQEVPLIRAVRGGAENPRHDLHVRARDVPAELDVARPNCDSVKFSAASPAFSASPCKPTCPAG